MFTGSIVRSVRGADLDTGLLERNESAPFPRQAPVGIEIVALAVAALLEREKRERSIDAADRHSPWTYGGAWRMTGGASRHLRFGYGDQADDQMLDVTLNTTERGATLYYAGLAAQFSRQCKGDDIRIDLGARRTRGQVRIDGGAFHVSHAGRHISLIWLDPPACADEERALLRQGGLRG